MCAAGRTGITGRDPFYLLIPHQPVTRHYAIENGNGE